MKQENKRYSKKNLILIQMNKIIPFQISILMIDNRIRKIKNQKTLIFFLYQYQNNNRNKIVKMKRIFLIYMNKMNLLLKILKKFILKRKSFLRIMILLQIKLIRKQIIIKKKNKNKKSREKLILMISHYQNQFQMKKKK